MVKNFSLILPTRNRLYLVKRLFDSIVETTSNLDLIEIVLCVDENDTESSQITHPLLSIEKITIPRGASGMGDIFKLCYEKNTSCYMILINDDVIFRTKNWDIKILEAFSCFPDDLAFIYPNDLYYGKKLSSFPVFSRTVLELIGGVCPSGYKSHGIDSHLFDIFERLAALGYERRKYLPEVILEHMHYGVTLASYEGDNFCPDHSEDQSLYLSLADDRQRIAVKIAQYIQSHPERKFHPLFPSISVIMCISGDLSKSAKACLEAVYEDNKYRQLNYEIIIIADSLSKKVTISSLPKGLRCKTKLICCEDENTAKILHKAVAISNTDYLVFLNDECLPRSGWLWALVEAAADNNVGIVGSKWVNPRNGRIEHIGLSFFQDNGFIKETYLYKGFLSNHPAVNKVREFQAVKIPGMLIKRDVFLQMDEFDEDMVGLEYLDLCLKMRKLGKKVLYSPQASLYCSCQEIIKRDAGSSIGPDRLPLKLAGQVEYDLEKQLAEDGFTLCSKLSNMKSGLINIICSEKINENSIRNNSNNRTIQESDQQYIGFRPGF
jgi:hypothetical protein